MSVSRLSSSMSSPPRLIQASSTANTAVAKVLCGDVGDHGEIGGGLGSFMDEAPISSAT